ncbi:MAG: RluA family pseudouridine synthase [Elusimicrobiota bacterium]
MNPISEPVCGANPWHDVFYVAGPEHAGVRVDIFLRLKLKGRSRGQIQSWMAEGRILLGGRCAVKPAHRLRAGDALTLRVLRRTDPPAAFGEIPVIYEDECLLAVNKPGCLLTHPTDKTRQNSATEIVARQMGGRRPFLIHRLDRETSGVLLFAKTSDAARELASQFSERAARKRYVAAVKGRVLWQKKTVDAPLSHMGGEIRVRQDVCENGVPASTSFERLAALDGMSLILAEPKTGRLHQIRAHLSWIGHPVLGDKLYQDGGRAYLKMTKGGITADDLLRLGAPRQMLHAWTLSLIHPLTRRPLLIAAPLPPDFILALGDMAKDPGAISS